MPYTLCMRKRGKHTVLQKAAFWFGLGGAFLLLSAALMATFSQFGAELFPAYRHFSRALMGGLAWICSVVPFSVWSYVVVLLVAVLGVSLAVTVLRRESLLRWLGWVFSLGEGVKIIGPDEVVEQMKQEIQRLKRQYQ